MTDDDQSETYGHDLTTGGNVPPADHAASRFDGRARLIGAEWTPPPESPDDSYPMHLITGRTVYHFHTRTKTGRAAELNAAAPESWVEPAPSDAAELSSRRSGGLGLLRDLHDLYLLASYLDMAWMVVGRAAKGLVIKSSFALSSSVTKRRRPSTSG